MQRWGKQSSAPCSLADDCLLSHGNVTLKSHTTDTEIARCLPETMRQTGRLSGDAHRGGVIRVRSDRSRRSRMPIMASRSP